MSATPDGATVKSERPDPSERPNPSDPARASAPDVARWTRDMGVLLALPAMWVHHEPPEIMTGLLSVLVSVLQLDAAYARFDDPPGDEQPLESWRPSAPDVPHQLRLVLEAGGIRPSGIQTTDVTVRQLGRFRVTSLPLSLPWETGLVVVSARRRDFPTERETYLLRVAVGHAAIAIHTARRIAREQAAHAAAAATLLRQNDILRSLVEEVRPSLESISRRMDEANALIAAVDAMPVTEQGSSFPRSTSDRAETARTVAPSSPLTRRETEVLGLVAQGLSNREIAGVMWLSDRTVERHVTSLYRKIGVARRSEATAYALRHGVA